MLGLSIGVSWQNLLNGTNLPPSGSPLLGYLESLQSRSAYYENEDCTIATLTRLEEI